MTENTRIAKNTMFMYLRMFSVMCVGLYTSRVILSSLGFIDYGLYNVIGGIIAMFGFLNGAMTNTISRFLTFELGKNDMRQLKMVFGMSILVQIILGLIIVLLGETIGLWFLHNKMAIPSDRMFAADWVYQLTILSSFVIIVAVPYNALVIAREKMSAFAVISILEAVLKLLIAYALIISPYDRLIFYATLLFLVQVINVSVYYIYTRHHFVETRAKMIWQKNLFYKMFSFASWSTIGNLFNVFYTQGVNIILNVFCGPTVNAARGIATQVENVARQFASNVQTAINPQIIKTYSVNDLPRMYTLIYASSRYCFFLLFLIEFPIMLQSSYILGLWLGKYPQHTEVFLILTLCNTLLDSLINPMFTANLASGKIKIYHLCNSITSTCFIPITYFSLKYTGIPETVFLCVIGLNIVGIVVRMFIARHQIGMGIYQYLINVICRISPVVIIVIICIIPIHKLFHTGILGLLETIFATSTIILLATFMFGITPDERKYVVVKTKNIVYRINNN